MQSMQPTRRSAHHAVRVRELFQRCNSRLERDPLAAQALDELAQVLEALQTTEEELTYARDRQADGYALLQAEYQTYVDLFTHAPFAYLTTRLDGTIRRANLAAQQLLHTDAHLAGRSLADVVAPQQRREIERLLQHLSRTPGAASMETTLQPAEGTVPPIKLAVFPASTSSGRTHELRWVLQTPEIGATTPQPAPALDTLVRTRVRFFTAALSAIHQAPAWTSAGLQLAHLAVSSFAHVCILERVYGEQVEQILAVRNGTRNDETHMLRQRAPCTTPDPAPAGELTIADDAALRRLGLPNLVANWSAPHLPLRGYAARYAPQKQLQFHLICLHVAAETDYSADQRAMLDLLLEEVSTLDTGEKE
jgi:PAS domain S-box-containing protein